MWKSMCSRQLSSYKALRGSTSVHVYTPLKPRIQAMTQSVFRVLIFTWKSTFMYMLCVRKLKYFYVSVLESVFILCL